MQDEMRHKQELIKIKRKNLQHLEKKAALYSPLEVPLYLLGEIDDLKEEIARLEQEIGGTQPQPRPPFPGKSRVKPAAIVVMSITFVTVLYALTRANGGNMLTIWNTLLAVIAGIVLDVLGNYIYDLLRNRGWLPARPSIKIILLIILFFVPLIMLLVQLRVDSKPGNGGNYKPVIQNISVNPEIIEIGQEATITVNAMDPDGDPLTYVWAVSNGKIVGGPTQQSTVTYKAPDTPGDIILKVIVRDGRGGETEQRRSISIVMPSSTP